MAGSNLEELAQQVWNTSDTISKKGFLFEMIENFKYKEKQEQFRIIVERTERSDRLDKLAADLMLADRDKVINF
jgi:hypothetical protein